MKMRSVHVGGGTARGAMTIFPIWGEFAPVRPYTAAPGALSVVEQNRGSTVESLEVENLMDLPVMLFEGQILEGGWQNRMVARSYVLDARTTALVDVVCVEEGRWGGGREHCATGRRASGRLRSALHTDHGRQQAVWSRVQEYEAAFGATATSSYTDHADRLTDHVDALADVVRPLPGQIGLVVAVSGQPVFAEIFADHDSLVREFDAIVRAAGMDAVGLPPVETPSRRARRFVDRADQVSTRIEGAAGLGRTLTGGDQYAHVSVLSWDGADAHLVLTNPRHALNRVSA